MSNKPEGKIEKKENTKEIIPKKRYNKRKIKKKSK
jgi:hypothetical protein